MRSIVRWLIVLALALGFAFYPEKPKASEGWSTGTYKLHKNIMELGMSDDVAKMVINQCKAEAKNPRHCVRVAVSISKAESNLCNNASNNNCWGFRSQQFDTKTKAFQSWLKSYVKYWYKANSGTFFYGPHKKGTSYYCTDEESSGNDSWCPNGKKHFNSVFFKTFWYD